MRYNNKKSQNKHKNLTDLHMCVRIKQKERRFTI